VFHDYSLGAARLDSGFMRPTAPVSSLLGPIKIAQRWLQHGFRWLEMAQDGSKIANLSKTPLTHIDVPHENCGFK
jgi:hypothetical protein